jgi:hypothetical protein
MSVRKPSHPAATDCARALGRGSEWGKVQVSCQLRWL